MLALFQITNANRTRTQTGQCSFVLCSARIRIQAEADLRKTFWEGEGGHRDKIVINMVFKKIGTNRLELRPIRPILKQRIWPDCPPPPWNHPCTRVEKHHRFYKHAMLNAPNCLHLSSLGAESIIHYE